MFQSSLVFLFLLIRLPSRSTLFPYTTLFRSWIDRDEGLRTGREHVLRAVALDELDPWGQIALGYSSMMERRTERSEEHTSELQSRQYLVCRLLLEKKKKSIMCVLAGISG